MQKVFLTIKGEKKDRHPSDLPAVAMFVDIESNTKAFTERLKTVTLAVCVTEHGKVRLLFTPLEGGKSDYFLVDSALPDLRVYFERGASDRVTVTYRSPTSTYLAYKALTILPKVVTGE